MSGIQKQEHRYTRRYLMSCPRTQPNCPQTWFLAWAIAASMLATCSIADAQPSVVGIKIDGNVEASEWGSTTLDFENWYNVSVPEIDFHGYGFRYGGFFQDLADYHQNFKEPPRFKDEQGRTRQTIRPEANWVLALAFKFGGDALGGPVESAYEVFVDVYPEQDRGHAEGAWQNFKPEYRFQVKGKNGKIETERYQFWDGKQWVGEEMTDAPEFQAAIGGPFYECLIPWSSIGTPLGKSATAPEPEDDYPFLFFGAMSSQGDKHDYNPTAYIDETTKGTVVTGPFSIDSNEVDVVTAVRKNTWGEVKQLGSKADQMSIQL
ncbi:MAG: hypothetical protein IT369_23335 [Candidatus Latescibacteria bacterium]|nr:hypothetical protein [Candidatus Latescibacterota bacterium]